MNLITGIQKYSIHDGDGIRTTVFFKGCHLNCLWCHNPETKSFKPQLMFDSDKCTACGACITACPSKAISIVHSRNVCDRSRCSGCGICTEHCLQNLREIAGTQYTVDDLFDELKKDEMFYEESGGGVTLSGGEVMAGDIDFVYQLVKRLDRQGISVTIDTCGMAPKENYEKIRPFVDTFLYDIKVINDDKHKKYIGASNKTILENLEMLQDEGARLYIRIPLIKEVNADKEDVEEIIDYMREKKICPAGINLLPYHNTGSGKYEKLGEEYRGKDFHAPTDEEMNNFMQMFQDKGFNNIKIGG